MREDVEAEWCATAGLNDCQHPRAEPTRPWCSFLSAVSNRCETPSQSVYLTPSLPFLQPVAGL